MIINQGGQNNVIRLSDPVCDSYYLGQIQFLREVNEQLVRIIESQGKIIGEQINMLKCVNLNKGITYYGKNKKK